MSTAEYGLTPTRRDVEPTLHPSRVLLALVVSTIAILFAAAILPRLEVGDWWQAVAVALLIAVINAVVPPAIAALRLPYTVATAFLLVLLADVAALRLADALTENAIRVHGFLAGL